MLKISLCIHSLINLIFLAFQFKELIALKLQIASNLLSGDYFRNQSVDVCLLFWKTASSYFRFAGSEIPGNLIVWGTSSMREKFFRSSEIKMTNILRAIICSIAAEAKNYRNSGSYYHNDNLKIIDRNSR